MAGFIFDMDGCLLDTVHVWFEAERRILETMGIQLTKEEHDKLNTLTLEEAGEWFHERFGIPGDGSQVAESIRGRLLEYYRTRVQANSGAVEFVKAVYDAGKPLCVLSSSPQAFLQAGLAQAGLKEFFPDALIISAEDRGWIKRDRETFEQVCALLGTAPAETWLFDDSWYALESAREVGVRCVGVYSDDGCGTHEELARHAEIVVDSFAELNVQDFLD